MYSLEPTGFLTSILICFFLYLIIFFCLAFQVLEFYKLLIKILIFFFSFYTSPPTYPEWSRTYMASIVTCILETLKYKLLALMSDFNLKLNFLSFY